MVADSEGLLNAGGPSVPMSADQGQVPLGWLWRIGGAVPHIVGLTRHSPV